MGSRYNYLKNSLRCLVTLQPKYRQIKYCCPCTICILWKHPCAFIAACCARLYMAGLPVLNSTTWFVNMKFLLDLAYQLCFCCQFVCISVWMTWLQELSGHTYLAWNDGWAPCIQYRRRKQQDGSTVVARTFSHSVTCKPQYVCIHRMMVNRGQFVERWQTFLWKVEDCPHSWVWRSSHSCWHNLNQHAQS